MDPFNCYLLVSYDENFCSLCLWIKFIATFCFKAHPDCGKTRLLTHPEVIHDLDRLLKLDRDVHGDVVVETGTHGEVLRERQPVILPT